MKERLFDTDKFEKTNLHSEPVKRVLKADSGITLIALVVTIIVLLILAGVALSLVMGDNGTINRTITATETHHQQAAKEKAEMLIESCKIDIYAEKHRMPNLQELADWIWKNCDGIVTILKSKDTADLRQIDTTGYESIIIVLAEYDEYEIEIKEENGELKVKSINGAEIPDSGNGGSGTQTEDPEPQTPPEYTITYDAGEGTPSKASDTGEAGTSIEMATATREGYQFDGWYTLEDGGEERNYTTMPSSDETLYAHWKLICTISFNSNGGTGTMTSAQVIAGSNYKVPENGFSKNGYVFVGWKDGNNNDYVDEATIENVTGNIELIAQWLVVNELQVGPPSAATASTGTFTVKCVNGTIESKNGSSFIFRITPYEAPTGYKFSHWIDKFNNIFSYNFTQDVMVITDNIYTPVYVKSDEQVNKQVCVSVYGSNQTVENKLVFQAFNSSDLDMSNYEITTGVLLTNILPWANEEYMIASRATDMSGEYKFANGSQKFTDNSSNSCCLNKSNVGSDTWYARGYAIVTNKVTGASETYYSKDIVSAHK